MLSSIVIINLLLSPNRTTMTQDIMYTSFFNDRLCDGSDNESDSEGADDVAMMDMVMAGMGQPNVEEAWDSDCESLYTLDDDSVYTSTSQHEIVFKGFPLPSHVNEKYLTKENTTPDYVRQAALKILANKKESENKPPVLEIFCTSEEEEESLLEDPETDSLSSCEDSIQLESCTSEECILPQQPNAHKRWWSRIIPKSKKNKKTTKSLRATMEDSCTDSEITMDDSFSLFETSSELAVGEVAISCEC